MGLAQQFAYQMHIGLISLRESHEIMHIHFSWLQIQVRGLAVAGASLYSVSMCVCVWGGGYRFNLKPAQEQDI